MSNNDYLCIRPEVEGKIYRSLSGNQRAVAGKERVAPAIIGKDGHAALS